MWGALIVAPYLRRSEGERLESESTAKRFRLGTEMTDEPDVRRRVPVRLVLVLDVKASVDSLERLDDPRGLQQASPNEIVHELGVG